MSSPPGSYGKRRPPGSPIAATRPASEGGTPAPAFGRAAALRRPGASDFMKRPSSTHNMSSMDLKKEVRKLTRRVKPEEPHPFIGSEDWERGRRLDSLLATVGPHGKEYMTPYVTCKECNAVNFIDNVLFFDARSRAELAVALPSCVSCGITLDMGLGADDHRALIAAKAKAREDLKRARRRGARAIQRAYRGMKGRQEYRERLRLHQLWIAKINLQATRIQTHARAAEARRIARVEKALLRIKQTVRSVLYDALRAPSSDGRKRHIWWYKRKAELDLIYEDYRTFVERTGRQPPRHVVEANIMEIAARINIIEQRNAIVIQSMFRGVVGRMFAKELMKEKARLKAVRTTATIILQRWWRHIMAATLLEELRFEARKEVLRKQYAVYKKGAMDKVYDNVIKTTALNHYKREVREARVAVAVGKTSFKACGGRKVLAYHQSAYGGDATAAKMVREFLFRRADDRKRQESALAARVARNEYIDKRVDYKEGFKYFFDRESTGLVQEKERMRNIVIDRSKICHWTPLDNK